MTTHAAPRGAPARVVAADWSGAREPAGGLAVAAVEGDARGGVRVELAVPASREEAVAGLVAAVRRGGCAVGLDFAFSYPAWFVRRERCADAPAFWARVAARGGRWLDDAPAPFSRSQLGRAAAEAAEGGGWPLFRPTERAVAGKRVTPKSVFQIGGNGQVGMASVRGMPYLPILRAAGAAVWPFDEPAAGQPTVVEIYPRVLYGDDVVKGDRDARTAYLAREHAHLSAESLDQAVANDHAFDAVTSALAMWKHRAALAALPPARDDAERLEGRIWTPDA